MSELVSRFPDILQLEVFRPCNQGVPEAYQYGSIVSLSESDEVVVELKDQIMDQITVHVRQGAIVRQYSHNRRNKKDNKLLIGKAGDFVDGEMVLVLHAYVNTRTYYERYYKPEIEECQKAVEKARTSNQRKLAEEQLCSINELWNNYDPKQYNFLPYIFSWKIKHLDIQPAFKPLPSTKELEDILKENESLREENQKLALVERLKKLEASAAELQATISQQEKQNKALQKQQDQLAQQHEEMEAALNQKRIDIDDLSDEQERLQYQAELMNSQIQEKRNSLAQAQAEMQALEDEIARLGLDRQALVPMAEQVEQLRQEKEQLEKEKRSLQGNVTRLKNKLKKLQLEHGDAAQQLQLMEEQLTVLPGIQQELEAVRNTYNRNRQTFVETLLHDLEAQRASETDIQMLQNGLSRLDAWQELSESVLQRKDALREKFRQLLSEYDNLKWEADADRANRQ